MDKKNSLNAFDIIVIVIASLCILEKLINLLIHISYLRWATLSSPYLLLFYALIIVAVIKKNVWMWLISLIPPAVVLFDFRPTPVNPGVPRGLIFGAIQSLTMGNPVEFGLFFKSLLMPITFFIYAIVMLCIAYYNLRKTKK